MMFYPRDLQEELEIKILLDISNIYGFEYQIFERYGGGFGAGRKWEREVGRTRVIGANYFGLVYSKQRSKYLGHCEFFTIVTLAFKYGAKKVKTARGYFDPVKYYDMLNDYSVSSKVPMFWYDIIDADAQIFYESFEHHFDEREKPHPVRVFYDLWNDLAEMVPNVGRKRRDNLK